jgi:hypothetical protein
MYERASYYWFCAGKEMNVRDKCGFQVMEFASGTRKFIVNRLLGLLSLSTVFLRGMKIQFKNRALTAKNNGNVAERFLDNFSIPCAIWILDLPCNVDVNQLKSESK